MSDQRNQKGWTFAPLAHLFLRTRVEYYSLLLQNNTLQYNDVHSVLQVLTVATSTSTILVLRTPRVDCIVRPITVVSAQVCLGLCSTSPGGT
jgi:hypothetical protein